jgi:hypothetical protein
LVDNGEANRLLEPGERRYKQDLYMEFITEYPDYGPKAKMTISRTRFYKWLISYAMFKEGVPPEEGRDQQGRWIRIRRKNELNYQQNIEL